MNKNKILISIIGVIGLLIVAIALYSSFIKIGNAETINRFEKIPDKPDDFDAYTRDIWKGAFVDLCELPKEYWTQPEFYGESWNRANKAFYKNPDYSKWGVYGQGNMPREISYTFNNFNQGESFELCTFFHNGFGVWTYQGFRLYVDGGEYFDVEVTPNEVTTSPTFPVFEDGWVKRISIKITPKKEVPTGYYKLKLMVVPPTSEYARAKTKEVLSMSIDKELYKQECYRFLKDKEKCDYLVNNREKKYVNGGSYQTSEALLNIGINIK